MGASGAPDNVNTRSIEQFIFSPRDVCALKKMIQARLPRSFVLTLTLGLLLYEGQTQNRLPYRMSLPSMATGDGDGAPSGSIPSFGCHINKQRRRTAILVASLSYIWLLPHVT